MKIPKTLNALCLHHKNSQKNKALHTKLDKYVLHYIFIYDKIVLQNIKGSICLKNYLLKVEILLTSII